MKISVLEHPRPIGIGSLRSSEIAGTRKKVMTLVYSVPSILTLLLLKGRLDRLSLPTFAWCCLRAKCSRSST
jgi:hypothetical protein